MARSTIPRLEFTHYLLPGPPVTRPIVELQMEPATAKALAAVDVETIAEAISLLADTARKVAGLTVRRRQKLAAAIEAWKNDARPTPPKATEIAARTAEIIGRALAVVGKRCGEEAVFESLAVASDETGRPVVRMRWGTASSWRALLRLCRASDKHFHAAPPRGRGPATEPLTVLED